MTLKWGSKNKHPGGHRLFISRGEDRSELVVFDGINDVAFSKPKRILTKTTEEDDPDSQRIKLDNERKSPPTLTYVLRRRRRLRQSGNKVVRPLSSGAAAVAVD